MFLSEKGAYLTKEHFFWEHPVYPKIVPNYTYNIILNMNFFQKLYSFPKRIK